MKYLYIFKKVNGDLFYEEETLAYKHIYQNENYREPIQYIGRIEDNEFRLTQPDIQDKVAEYRQKLLSEDPSIQKAIYQGARSGGFSQKEADFIKKVQDYSLELLKERDEALIAMSKKEYPDKSLNISTPGGNRSHILGQIR